MKRSFLYCFAICMAVSCGSEKGRIVLKNENHGDPVLTVEADDKEMNRAIDSAKKTYPGFVDYFTANSRDSTKSGFEVKVRFGLGDDCAEHMWLDDLYFKGNKFYGVLSNDPLDVQTLKLGDTLEIIADSVSDWMYIEKGRLVGGYTIKALYDKMGPKDQQEMEQEVGAKIR